MLEVLFFMHSQFLDILQHANGPSQGRRNMLEGVEHKCGKGALRHKKATEKVNGQQYKSLQGQTVGLQSLQGENGAGQRPVVAPSAPSSTFGGRAAASVPLFWRP